MAHYIRKAVLVAAMLALAAMPAYAVTDTYEETFDVMEEDATVDAVDSWVVASGELENAIAQSGDTAAGGGKALKLVAASTPVDVKRPASYGNTSPTWIEYVVKPGHGVDDREVPAEGIAAVQFGRGGKLLASDGTSWMDTGKSYQYGTWYRILLKVDFSTHMYDLYCEPAGSPKTPFIADKQNLHFIDPAVNAMSELGFMGSYNASYTADSLVDDLVVHTVDKLQFITSPHTLVKGHTSGLIMVQLQSANAEAQTTWRDIELELRSSTQTGEFSVDAVNWVPITSLVIPEGSQQVSFYYMDFAEGKPTLSVNEFPDRGWTDGAQEQKVVEEGEFFVITAAPEQTAGTPFLIQIAAMDGTGGIDTGYMGSVEVFAQYVTPQNGTKSLTPSEAAGFVLGQKEATVTYADAGTLKIGVRDQSDPSKIGYSGDIQFFPHSFSVEADPLQVVGKNFPVKVTALEAGGQITPNYAGPAKIEPVAVNPVSTTGVLNPSELTAGSFENGSLTFNTAYNRWGTINIKAFDSAHPEKTGTSESVVFTPKALSVTVKPPSSSRSFFYVAENMEITVSVLGQDDLPIENFQGTVSLTPDPAFNIPAQYAFVETDKGQKKFVAPAGAAGNYKLSIEDTQNSLTVESEPFEVRDATIVISNTSSPVGATAVEIQLVDKDGKRIKEENEMTLTILVQEENENGSIFFSELGKPVLFKNGLARVIIGDSEAETVTISARSKYGLKVMNGKVVFGRTGATGVGALMLRETKD